MKKIYAILFLFVFFASIVFAANNSGTLVIAPVRPQAEEDTYPSAYANEIKGGVHSVSDLTARNAIPDLRREEGMLCYVLSDSTLYVLDGGITNDDWEKLQISKLEGVDFTGWSTGKILKFDASGNLVVGTDNEGAGGTITLESLSATTPISYNNTTGVFSVAIGYQVPTTTEKTNYDTAYSHSQAAHAPANSEQNVQANWTVVDSGSDAYILNKPTIPSGNQIIDWTSDQGATNIHSGNYTDTNTTYTAGTGLLLIGTSFSNTDGGAAAVTSHQSTYNHSNYNTAYGWGNHASAGYLTIENDPAVGTHESTYNHTNFGTAYTHSQTATGNPHSLDYVDIGLSEKQVIDWTNASDDFFTTGALTAGDITADGISFSTQVNLLGIGDLIAEGDVTISNVLSTTATSAYLRGVELATVEDVSTHESTYNHSHYDTSYGWGNHATAGYIASTSLDSLSELDTQIGLTGTADGTTYLRGDGVWATPTGEGGGIATVSADANPDLGGDLDTLGYTISSSTGNVLINDTAVVDGELTINSVLYAPLAIFGDPISGLANFSQTGNTFEIHNNRNGTARATIYNHDTGTQASGSWKASCIDGNVALSVCPYNYVLPAFAGRGQINAYEELAGLDMFANADTASMKWYIGGWDAADLDMTLNSTGLDIEGGLHVDGNLTTDGELTVNNTFFAENLAIGDGTFFTGASGTTGNKAEIRYDYDGTARGHLFNDSEGTHAAASWKISMDNGGAGGAVAMGLNGANYADIASVANRAGIITYSPVDGLDLAVQESDGNIYMMFGGYGDSAVEYVFDATHSSFIPALRFVPKATESYTAEGSMYYDSDDDRIYFRNASAWVAPSKLSGDVYTGTHDFGGATLEIPNSDASPSSVGQLRHDTTVTGLTGGALEYHNGTNVRYVVDIDTAPSADDYVVAYDADADKFYMKTDATGEGGGYTNLTSFVDQTANRLFYSNLSGDVTELAFGAAGTYLQSQGTSSPPAWSTVTVGDAVSVDGASTVNPDFASTGDVDFVNTSNTVIANINTGAVKDDEMDYTAVTLNDFTFDVGSVDKTEFGYLNGVTSAIQTQLNGKITSTSIDTFSELDTFISDKALVNKADGAVWSGVHDFGGATSVEIPNGTNPTTDVAGKIAVDTNDNMLKLYGTASRGITTVDSKEMTIYSPHILNGDEIAMFEVDDAIYPHGITITKCMIRIPSDLEYTLVFEEWAGDPASAQNDIDSVATGASDAVKEETTISDAAVDANDVVFIDLPTTEVDWVTATILFTVNQGD
jgi:hypothetical protein